MATYIGSIFLSAFLLFQVQPMIAHYILPWFGGTNSVWSAVVLFFQLALIGGYLYAHWLNESVPQRRQWQIHGVLLGLALALITLLGFFWPSPVTPGASWKPTAGAQPILYIFLLLTISVGLPYFTLASNSPLIQAWFSRAYAGRSPYWLYALSNFGSAFGLLSYPFIVEPALRLQQQGWLWSALYALFAVLTGYGAWRASHVTGNLAPSHSDKKASTLAPPRISSGRRFLWLLLSAIATLMLLAVTNRLTQEIAPVPLLWILPLSVYLLSFIIAFSGENYYDRLGFSLLLTITSIGIIFTSLRLQTPLWLQISLYLLFLFAICMIAHGELYRLRPAPAHLTHFYLLISIGGALGGIAVNFLAPLLFNDYWEFYLGWLAIYLLLIFLTPTTQPTHYKLHTSIPIGLLAVIMGVLISYIALLDLQNPIWRGRNFYGALRVLEKKEEGVVSLTHGNTIHGIQYISAEKRQTITGYYHSNSGIGLALTSHPRYRHGKMKVGVIGLGIGTLAAYGQPGDIYRFYEINPLVIRLANGENGFFSFLSDSRQRGVIIEIIPGDARLSLERELQQGEVQAYDVLIADAFNGDAIPVHLLTQEAFSLYLQHLAPNGILAIHITNRHLDLTPIVWQAAHQHKLAIGIVRVQASSDQTVKFPSVWALLTRDPAFFRSPKLHGRVDTLDRFFSAVRPWTDDYSNLFQLLKGSR